MNDRSQGGAWRPANAAEDYRKFPNSQGSDGGNQWGNPPPRTQNSGFSSQGKSGPPTFYRSKTGQSSGVMNEERETDAPRQSPAQPSTSAQAFEPRGRQPAQPEERKGGNNRGRDSSEDASLTREKQRAAGMRNYNVLDGEFTSFPEIQATTAQQCIARGIKGLFPIQQHSFYPIYNREDIISRDLTGSGKTLAFCLPITEYLRKNNLLGQRRIQAIMLCPTRELAIQVQNELAKLKHHQSEFDSLTVYGGVSIDDQTRALRRGVDFFVGTCGRVLDHIERGNIDFSALKSVVLDEADQMLKQGFKEEVDKILAECRRQCGKDLQICLFSATIPRWVRDVAATHMKRDVRIVDLAMDLKNKTARNVSHLAIQCPYQNRLSALADILVVYGKGGKVIVFTQTKADANSLLLSDKIKTDIEVMHGDIAQNQREVTMKRFKEGKFRVLVATDVAARGLDIPNVDLVVQIEPPKETETYIHRSGRTARAGASGTCITFYMAKTKMLIEQIEQQAGIKLQRIGVPQPEDVIKASANDILGNLNDVNDDVLPLFQDTARALIEKTGGDAEKALCTALAYISGHYKAALKARSLITGQDRMITVKLESNAGGRISVGQVYSILKRYWPPTICDGVRTMRGMRSQAGAVFDLYEDQFSRFMDNWEHLQQQEAGRLDFDVCKCAELPELAEDDPGSAGGSGWRNDGGSGGDGYHGGGGRGYRGGYDGGRGGGRGGRGYRGGRGGGGGGYDGGYGGGGGYDGGYGGRGGGGGRGGWNGGGDQWGGNDGGAGWRSGGYDGGNQRGGYQQKSYDGGYGGGGYRGKGFRGGYQGGDYQSSASTSAYSTPNPYGGGSGGRGGFRGGHDGGSSYQAKPRGEINTVYVGNLNLSTDQQSLQGAFMQQQFDVRKVNILFNDQGKSKGAGFVTFGSADEAQRAVEQCQRSGLAVDGSRLIVQLARQ